METTLKKKQLKNIATGAKIIGKKIANYQKDYDSQKNFVTKCSTFKSIEHIL